MKISSLISSNYESTFSLIPGVRQLKVGINRLQKVVCGLKGGTIIIHVKIYGSILDINVEENISTVMLYNTITA
jgi:hypothetical protein